MEVLENSMNSAVIALKVLEVLYQVYLCRKGFVNWTTTEFKKMNHKSSAKGKLRRKQLRAIKKGYIDIEK